MIRFATFPKSEPTILLVRRVVDEFVAVQEHICSSQDGKLQSNDVLAFLRGGLETLGFEVEKNKTSIGKIRVPVLFGMNGVPEKTFEADAFHQASGVVMEVEAGRAVSNYQFLKDLFQACMMQEAKHLVIAVRNHYLGKRDFETVINFFETLYASARLQLPLTSVTIIGY